MKHFLIDIHYTAEPETIQRIRPAHRVFLRTGYDRNILILSGPKEPVTGGIAIARAKSLEEIQSFFQQDPYALENAATHTITEFSPVLYQSFIEDWIMKD